MTRTLAATLAFASVMGVAADWPGFRGTGTSTSAETNLPTGFSDTSGLRWKATLPGRGVSGVVTHGGRVYVTASSGPRDDRLHVLGYDAATGTPLWHRQLAATGSTAAHPDTCMAAPTPVADATGVYAQFASGDVAAFDADGTLRWYRSLVGDYPTITNQVGMASSPVLAAGKLIVPVDNYGESFLAALDLKTGQNVWKTPRPKEANWSTPAVRTLPGGKTEVIFPDRALTAYDADTGAKTWGAKLPGGIPSPTVAGDLLLSPGGGVTASRLEAGGVKELWKSARMQTGMSSPVAFDGKVYGVTSSGLVLCLDAATGKQDWDFRVKGKFSASPVAADGKLYLFNEEGNLLVVKLGAEPELIAESKTGERGQATPAVSGGAIFLRGDKTLFCVGAK